jgi:hypothetical protein
MDRARATGVLALGVIALHELTYLLSGGAAPGKHAGHSYLAEAIPVVVMLATALLAVALLAPLGGSAVPRRSRGIAERTLVYSAVLLGTLLVQELAEAALAPAHSLAPVAGGGGLIAIPLALALGTVAALVTRCLEGVEQHLAAAQLGALPRARRARSRAARPALAALHTRDAGASLAFGFARRPPPLTLPA